MSLIASPYYWTTGCVLLWQVGRQEPVMVLRVDKEKGYIDLSKRRVAAEDIQVGFQLCSLLLHLLDVPYIYIYIFLRVC